MKRSKMAGKLLHWLTINGYSRTDGHDTYTLNPSDAYNIIDYLEREGMKPPGYYPWGIHDRELYDWEPEDRNSEDE